MKGHSQGSQDVVKLREVSIVMPVRNDQDTLAAAVADAAAALEEVTETWELVVVDDASTDASRQVLQELAAREPRIRVLVQPVAMGLGAALRRGFDAARYLIVGTIDGSGRWDLRALPSLFPHLRGHALVAGVRSSDGTPARLPGAVYRWLVTRLTDVRLRDPVCPVRLLRMSFAQVVALQSEGATALVELVLNARRLGLGWAEAPVPFRALAAREPELVTPRLKTGFRELRTLR